MGRALRRTGYLLILAAVGAWVMAVFRYDPWRRNRVRAALVPGTSWHDALLAGETAAFPSSETFVVICMAGDGPAAEFERVSGRSYRLVQNGRVEPDGGSTRRTSTSAERFTTRADWAAAVSKLGERLRCESLTVIWPPTDALQVELDDRGRLVRVSTSAGE